MRVLQDTKLMQLQSNALDTAAHMIKALRSSTDLLDQQVIQEQLRSMTTDDRSSATKSQAQAVLALFAPNNGDVAMSDGA